VERRDLLEVLEDRYGKLSTVLTSQMPTKSWHESTSTCLTCLPTPH